jgi:hypothetical protein
LGDQVEAQGDERSSGTDAGSSMGCLATGMAGSDHEHIKLFVKSSH